MFIIAFLIFISPPLTIPFVWCGEGNDRFDRGHEIRVTYTQKNFKLI